MKFTVTVDENDVTEEGFLDAAVFKATSMLVSRCNDEIKNRVMLAVEKTIAATAQAVCDEALHAKVPDTDRLGQARGPAKSIHERMMEAAIAHVSEKVNCNGDRPGYEQQAAPRYAWVAMKAAQDVLKDAAKLAADAVKAEVNKGLQTIIVDAVKKAVGIKT